MKFSFSRKTDLATTMQQGVWVSLDDKKFAGELILEDPGDGPAVRVCSTESKRYKDGYDKGVRQFQKVIRSDNFIQWDMREKIENLGMLDAITGWIVSDDEGNPVEFSKENVRYALEHDPEFRGRVFSVATDLANYKRREEDADTENLPRTSAMSSSGEETNGAARHGTIPLPSAPANILSATLQAPR